MRRKAAEHLDAWMNSPLRKPLLVQGARQVGKTWLIKDFGSRRFNAVAYVSFLDDDPMRKAFDDTLDPERLLDAITLFTGVDAKAETTLVVFDEVQECPRALMAMKAFAENRPQTFLIAAGSLLGVALHRGVSFPVGKVDHLTIYPMTFLEFLDGVGEERMSQLVRSGDTAMMATFSGRLTDLLRRYYYVGGMPEAVQTFALAKNYAAVAAVHERLLADYELDFSKYAEPETAERIRLVWSSLPGQLARENKKFVYGAVKEGARARGYEEAIQWLVDSGLVIKVNRISKPGLPLSGYVEREAFKLYLLDVGLLAAASRLPASVIVEGNRLFTEFKGSLTENYACQQLVASGKVIPYYWSAVNSSGEVDFVYDYEGRIVPLEVKAETNLKAKSLRLFVERNGLERGIRLSLSPYQEQSWVTNVPLYAADLLPEWSR